MLAVKLKLKIPHSCRPASEDVAAYAVMSNRWNDKEVVEHWHQIFLGTEITQKFVKGEVIESYEVESLKHSIAQYRSRLSDISC